MDEESDEHRVVGDEFEVRLASTPTTGYRWQVGELPEGVELLDSRFERGEEPAPGDSGHEVFRFRLRRPGAFDLPFVLKRPWLTEIERTRLVRVRKDD